MDRHRPKNPKEKIANRSRKNFKKETFNHRNGKKLEKILQKVKKEPLNSQDLKQFLKHEKNFIGFFPSDRLKTLYILAEPIYLILNIDNESQPGSHWIAIRIGKSTVEIFDSLGLNPQLWSFYPKDFFTFLNRYRFTHQFYITPLLQPPNSYYCGLYCVYYILYRQGISFRTCVGKFSLNLEQNNAKLASLLIKKI